MIEALRVDGLGIVRGERLLFRALDFTVAAGEVVALTGPNGSGKTSLLRCIAGLLRPDAGTIAFEGPGGPLDPDEARRSHLHLLGHQDGLKLDRTAAEELAFACRWTGATDASVRAAVGALELEPLLDLEVRMLSAGQRRRLALARLAASPRSIWLLDEPLAPLDAARRSLVASLIEAHGASGGIVVAAVHDALPMRTRALELAA